MIEARPDCKADSTGYGPAIGAEMAATIQIRQLAPLGSVRGLLNEITLIDGDVPSAGSCSHR